MLINKIGDICLLLSFGFIYYFFNTFDYYVIFEVLNICDANFFNSHFFYNETFYFCKFYLIDAILLPISEFSFIELNLQKIFLLVAYFIVFCLNSYLYWIALLLFLGAMGKSAQMGFHTWLPDAMEGPTPVSALIHAATMVTAGVFLVIRCSPFFVLTPNVTNFIIFIGSFTAIFAGTIALVQYDMKKIIAYSTCSQLGYMFFSCGLLNFDVALFHLVNHAFFKALLFLSSGVLIHAMFDEQDLRRFGGLFRIMPITYVMVLIGSIALTGIPFFTGYYSKDLIIELSVGSFTFFGNLAYCFGLMGCLLTACYSLRLVRYVFFLIPNKKKFLILAHEGDYTLLFPLFLLSFFSIFFGFLFKEIYIGIGSDIFVDVFYRSLNFFDSEFFFSNGFNYFLIKNLPLLFAFFGFFFNYYFLDLINALINYLLLIQLNNSLSLKILEFRYKLLTYFFFRWYIDNLYSDFAYKLFLYFINFFYFLDRGFIEKLPLFIIDKVKISKLFFNLIQSGYIYIYIYLILFFSLLFLNIVIFGIL
jgi:NADH-ubiquinone oxidoreductase chain 5